jgi:hypothetical protein
MKPRSILTISLLTVILLVSCAPAATPAPTQPEAPVQPTATVTELPVEPSPLPTEGQPSVAATEASPTEAPTEVPQPLATSRGPNLEATNPETVSLASGDLQLVEFFRYT